MRDIVPMELHNKRMITTELLAEAYGTEPTNIKKNFNSNKDRFTEGKHYYQLTGEELRAFKGVVTNSDDPSIKFASILTLWTEKGAARHAKILDTDEAWEVFEELEESYFRVREQRIDITALSPELQMFQKIFNQVAQSQLEQKKLAEEFSRVKVQTEDAQKKAQILEHRINNLDAVNLEGTTRQRLNAVVKRLAFDKGITVPSAWHEFRKAFNVAFKTNIEQKKTNYQGKFGNKTLSYPEYLEKVGLLEDALRVADKLINGKANS